MPKLFDGFASACCMRNHVHIRLVIDDFRKSLSHQRVVIDAENANAERIGHRVIPSFMSLRVRLNRPSKISRSFAYELPLLDPGCRNTIFPGTTNSTSVPEVGRL